MKKINYKGRCEKRKVSKCEDICRTYSGIQSAMVDMESKMASGYSTCQSTFSIMKWIGVLRQPV